MWNLQSKSQSSTTESTIIICRKFIKFEFRFRIYIMDWLIWSNAPNTPTLRHRFWTPTVSALGAWPECSSPITRKSMMTPNTISYRWFNGQNATQPGAFITKLWYRVYTSIQELGHHPWAFRQQKYDTNQQRRYIT